MKTEFSCSVILLLVFTSSFHCFPDDRSRNCKAYRRPALHEALNQICSVCHEMFSVDLPNFHAECHSNCFRNPQFNRCLNVFRPKLSNFISSVQ